MPSQQLSKWLPIIGVMLMGLLFALEIWTHILATVAYIAIAVYSLWLTEKKEQMFLIATVATLLMILGYLIGANRVVPADQLTFVINRIMGILVVWSALYFTLRYRNFQKEELRQRNEIQEIKLAEERLRSSQEMYRAIARNFPEGWIGILDEKLNYVFVEGKGLDRVGLRAETLVGENFFQAVKNQQTTNYLNESIQGRDVTFEVEFSNRTFEVNAGPLYTGHRKNRILLVLHDITELKRTEMELIKSLEKERELGDMKSRFVTLASHEFRTPLTTILSSSSLLQSYSGEKYDKEKIVHIGRIKRSVKILNEILDDFLSLGKLQEGAIKSNPEFIDFHEFLFELEKEIEPLKRGNQRLLIQHQGEFVIKTDRKLLRNILYNLLSNAFKYTHHDDEVLVTSTVEEQKLIVKVSDHGIGIPESEQKYIFKRFYRAQNVTNIQGTGLGLNIVKKYVTLVGGSIEFKSESNHGTTFTLVVPVQLTEDIQNLLAV